MPFKDYKGNVIEAMTKLIKDLKSFGYSGWKTLTSESIKSCFGDQVCGVITELINLELYRRNFQFLNPIFPKEEEEEVEDDSFAQDSAGMKGQEEGNEQYEFIINNGRIEPVEGEVKDSLIYVDKKKKKPNLIEETKTGFYQVQWTGGDELYDLEKAEED